MPAEVDHFTYGIINPLLAYAFSVLGSLLALICCARAQATTKRRTRAKWLLLASWSLGGTGIWVMHFTAMLGFSVPNSLVRFEPVLTLLSWAVAVGVVGAGLFIAAYGQPHLGKTLFGGLFTGLGVAAMHYLGMAAMRVNGTIEFEPRFLATSVGIAVVTSTVALWFAVRLRRHPAIVAASLLLGAAVSGMHYTGMAGLRVRLHPIVGEVTGINALVFLGPMMVFVVAVVITLAYALLRSTDQEHLWSLDQPADAVTPSAPSAALWTPVKPPPVQPPPPLQLPSPVQPPPVGQRPPAWGTPAPAPQSPTAWGLDVGHTSSATPTAGSWGLAPMPPPSGATPPRGMAPADGRSLSERRLDSWVSRAQSLRRNQ